MSTYEVLTLLFLFGTFLIALLAYREAGNTGMMFVISISHKNADAKIRERMALVPERAAALQAACRESGILETVYLSTCNRCELYGNGDYAKALLLLAKEMGEDPSKLKNYILVKQENAAVKHLFHVASGMDSMVIGEDEILGQLRKAYLNAKEHGFTGFLFHTVFQAALEAAKRVKTETLLSKSSVSIATLAAAQCHKFSDGWKKVLLIGGSGDTGSKVIKNLLSYGDCEITATTRKNHGSADGIKIVPFADRYQYMEESDIIISATSSPHYTVTRAMLEEHKAAPKRRLFVDLAVPSDIDDCVVEMPGSVLLKIDDFEKIAERNNEIKKNEVQTAEEILLEGIDELRKELVFHNFYPKFSEMKERMPKDMEQFIYRYRKAANADEFTGFINVLLRMEAQR